MKTDVGSRKKFLYVASTSSHLRRFHEPYLEGLKQDFDVYTMANGEGVDFSVPFQKSIFSFRNLGAIGKIRKILKRHRFDAVILNTSLAAFLVRLAMIGMRRRPVVLNIAHGYLFDLPAKGKKDRLMLMCEKITARYTDTLAVMNEADLKIATEHTLCRGEVHFINGMGYTLPGEPIQKDHSLRSEIADEKDYLLTFVGELSARKNQMFLIRCVKKLVDQGLPIRLMLVGEGAERGNLEAEIQRLELSDRVILTGNQEPIWRYLSITDLYVSASRIEGLPFNLMEAMACELPIVASDCKGQVDLLKAYPKSLYSTDDIAGFCQAVSDAYHKNLRGIGSAQYPNLRDYTLEAVYQTDLDLMKGILENDEKKN